MKVKKNIYKIILAVVLIGAIVAVGVFSYRSGVAYGIAQNIDVEALQEGAVPFMRGMHPLWNAPWYDRFQIWRFYLHAHFGWIILLLYHHWVD